MSGANGGPCSWLSQTKWQLCFWPCYQILYVSHRKPVERWSTCRYLFHNSFQRDQGKACYNLFHLCLISQCIQTLPHSATECFCCHHIQVLIFLDCLMCSTSFCIPMTLDFCLFLVCLVLPAGFCCLPGFKRLFWWILHIALLILQANPPV